MKNILMIIGIAFLFIVETLRVYLIMPMPGSQQADTIDLAYWISQHIEWLRMVGLLLVAYPAYLIIQSRKRWPIIGLASFILCYIGICYLFNYKMEADKMFYQPSVKIFKPFNSSSIAANKLILGISINGIAKAYPIQYIGYHHQVSDNIGGDPIIVTYCTVCRTGRIFSSIVNGKQEQFRLVGMDHFNAMFEDKSTKSWWRQATGEAITGPLKGQSLKEMHTEQLTLSAWLRKYPTTLIMQPDTTYKDKYEKMDAYDKGLSKSDLTKRDSGSWHAKSWVVGIEYNNTSKAYDWNMLVKKQFFEDSISGLPLLVTIEKDTASFHVFNRSIDGLVLSFEKNTNRNYLKDKNTGSLWNADGKSIEGALMGKQLNVIRAYQEFWHSWKTFHPGTSR